MHTNLCYLALGSNLNDPKKQLDSAIQLLQRSAFVQIEQVSSYYLSAPYGPVQDQPSFINCVLRVRTHHTPFVLLALCAAIEEYMGRERLIRWGSRIIDLDIILFNQLSIHTSKLTIPHSDMFNRAFVIEPLLEVLLPAMHSMSA